MDLQAQTVRDREGQTRTMIDSIPVLVWSCRPDGATEFVNQRWLDYTGLSMEQATGWGWKRAIHPDDLEQLMKTWVGVLDSGESGEEEARLRHFDGEFRWFLFRAVPIRDNQGRIVRWDGTCTDIEDLKRAEQNLTQAENRLRIIIDTIPTMVFSALPDGSIDFVSQSWLDYTGFSMEDWLGWGWKTVVHPEDLNVTAEKWQAALASGEKYECEVRTRTASGLYRWCLSRAVPLRDDMGTIVRWYGTNTDIEDLKRAENELRRSEMELQRITDAIPQLIIVLGSDGNILYVNQFVTKYTGLSMEGLVSDDAHRQIFHPDDIAGFWDTRLDALARGTPFELELRVCRKDGQHRWFLMRYNPLYDDNGRVIRWYGAATDIEERKQAEQKTQRENLSLREEIDHTSMFEEIVGSSAPLNRVLGQVVKVSPTDSTVLICGETGTGKELIARAIHRRSKRSKGAFIRVNCAAMPASLIPSELFGHEKGAFTGALQRRLGRFELADGGTIFLDEIGDLSMETQVALLRVLQEREFERVGGSQSISVNVRVLAATNRDLKSAVAAGTFREDLFFRLNVFPIQMPSLRERIDDIPLLVEYLIDRYATKAGKKIRFVSRKTLEMLQAYKWPGNIRELQNVIERAVILSEGESFAIDEKWLGHESSSDIRSLDTSTNGALRLDESQERKIIEKALAESRGRVSGPFGAAIRLGAPRQTIESKIASLGIDKHRFKSKQRDSEVYRDANL